MDKNRKHQPWHNLLGTVAGTAALCLLLTFALSGDWAKAAAGEAALELSRPEAVTAAAEVELGDTVIPLGRAVGIKLFSDGVLVVGLSSGHAGGTGLSRPHQRPESRRRYHAHGRQ